MCVKIYIKTYSNIYVAKISENDTKINKKLILKELQ